MKVWVRRHVERFSQKLALKTGFGVFAYSRAGYGGSDPLHFRALLITCRLRQKTRYQKYWIKLVFNAGSFGHSDGATIAACYGASVSDQRIRGLILMAPHFFTEEIRPFGNRQSKSSL